MALVEEAMELVRAVRKDGGPDSYNKWASKYDELLGTRLNYIGFNSVLSKWGQYCSQDIPEGRRPRILDAGCGTGLLGQQVNTVVSLDNVELYGGDYSPGMLEEAKQKGVYHDLKVINLKAVLPYEEGFFDSIVSSGVFSKSHCGPSCLPNVIRVLKKGGYFITTVKKDLYALTEKEWEKVIDECNCKLIEMPDMPYHDESSALVFVIKKN